MNFPTLPALVALLALATGGFLHAKETPEALLGRLPPRIAECQKGDLKNYSDPRLGASVAYRADGLTITVYVYDLGRETIADGLADPVVQEAFRMAKNEIQTATERGMYSDTHLLSDGRGTFNEREGTLQARYELTRQQGADAGLKIYSEIDVFGAWNQIIKLRISGDRRTQQKTEPIARQFVADLLKAIEFLPPARP